MIGVINRTKIFEFSEIARLDMPLDFLGSRYDCNIIIITDAQDRIKGIVYNEEFILRPSLFEETTYYLYGTNNVDFTKLELNDILPKYNNWAFARIPFAFCNQNLPKELSLY